MKTLNVLFHIMRADFFERIRRYSFFVVAAVTVYLGIQYVPPVEAGYLTVSMNGTRGIYNSAWVGTMFGFMLALIVPLFGFYIIKVSVSRDRDTGVGQIIASTKVKKIHYLFGKVFSNLAVLLLIALIMMLIAPVMQFIRGESMPIDWIQLYMPMVWMGLPMAVFVAVIGVLFETVGWLRGGFGNAVYLFLWVMLVAFSSQADAPGGTPFDYMGIGEPLASMEEAFTEQHGEKVEEVSIGTNEYNPDDFEPYHWEGLNWTWNYIFQRIIYMLLTLMLVLLAVLFFDRFDPAAHRQKKKRNWVKNGIDTLMELFPNRRSQGAAGGLADRPSAMTPIEQRHQKGRIGVILYAEFLLLVKGQTWWWYLVLIGLNMSAISSPADEMLNSVLPMVWIWSVLVWSKLGSREVFHNTHQIVFSAPRPVFRNLSAAWLAGVCFSAIATVGVGLKLLFAGLFPYFFAWIVCVIFVPSLAIALSAVSGSHRLFEVAYLLLWYMAINNIVELDFLGHTAEAVESGIPMIYLGISLILLVISIIGRAFRVGYGFGKLQSRA